MPRLRRADCSTPGFTRVRRGKGFSFRDEDGRPIEEEDVLARLRGLAIPPAWRDVWICPDPLGHLQATGIDAAGRKQYRYHDRWRERRDREKFEAMVDFARALPSLRRRVTRDLRASPELDRGRVLACATRLLDVGFFRIGSEDYTDSFGLATMRKEHVTLEDDEVIFEYPGKSGQLRHHAVVDPDVREIVGTLRRRRGGGDELLAYREGRRWRDVRSDDINDYVKEIAGDRFTAKDFRTWNGTLLAAVALAEGGTPVAASKAGRQRAIVAATKHVSDYLGNTPAVARSAYIDPRVFDRYRSGWVIALEELGGPEGVATPGTRERIEAAVVDLLRDEADDSPVLEQAAAA